MQHAVIMAGGSGTRLWPLSRAARPKQLLDVVDDAGRRGAQPAGRGVRAAGAGAARRADLGVHRRAATPTRCGRPCRGCAPTGWCSSRPPATRPTPSGSARRWWPTSTPTPSSPSSAPTTSSGPSSGSPTPCGRRTRPSRSGRGRWSPSASRRPRRPPASATCSAARPSASTAWPRRPRSGRSPTARPPSSTSRRASTSGTRACSSGGRRPCSTRWRSTCPSRPTGCGGSSRRLPGRTATPSWPRSSRRCRRSASTTRCWSRRPPSPDGCSSSTSTSTGSTSGRGRRWRTRCPSTPTATPCAGSPPALDSAGNVVLSDDPDHLVALVGVRDSVVVHTADVTMVCPVADAERVKALLTEVERRYGTAVQLRPV